MKRSRARLQLYPRAFRERFGDEMLALWRAAFAVSIALKSFERNRQG
jgi:hypothetical protein